MDEFGIISKYLKPLATSVGAFGLTDDAAVVAPPPGEEIVITKDAILAGVHFLTSDPLDLVARKLLRVNLSDLAAKGARPLGYLMACCWPKTIREADIALFASGLAADQAAFGISLLGGDTTPTGGPLAFSLTALGTLPRGQMVRRSGAGAGDRIYVTGTIGDAGLGLMAARGDSLGLSAEHAAYLMSRYRVPEPRSAFGMAARRLMLASIDISDGLVADAGHLADASEVGIRIALERLPLSPAASAWVAQGGDPVFLATCGDDYEICLAAPASAEADLRRIADRTQTQLTMIGEVTGGQGVELIGPGGRKIDVPAPGPAYYRAGPF